MNGESRSGLSPGFCSKFSRSGPWKEPDGMKRSSFSQGRNDQLAARKRGHLVLNGLDRAAPPAQHKSVLCIASKLERSEEHTSELQSLMRISYAVFCLKKKNNRTKTTTSTYQTQTTILLHLAK